MSTPARLTTLLPALLLCGCASVSRGKEFPVGPVEGLKDTTTKAEAMETFGEPLYRSASRDGQEVWVYQHATLEISGFSREARTNRLTLEFQDETLQDFEFVTYQGMPEAGSLKDTDEARETPAGSLVEDDGYDVEYPDTWDW